MATVEGLSPVEQIRRFWRWWMSELAACIPSSFRNWVRRLSVLPMVVADKGSFGIFRYDGKTWSRIATAQGETTEAVAKELAVQLRAARIDRFAVGLPPGQYLSKTLSIPQAAEENLHNALLYELDRHTPFKPEDVGFDCAIVGRNEGTREIIVRLVIAPKMAIANAVAATAATGMTVATVQPALPDRDSIGINLLPHDDSANRLAKRLMRWMPWLILVTLGVIAISLPILQKRAQVIELQPLVNVAAQQASAADALNQQLDRAQSEYNFVLQRRYAMPTALQLLNEVTHILPDDTWLQSFELRTTQKGRELQLQGETGVSGKMIELFEQSPLVSGASFKSPVTQAPGSTASRFHIGMDVKEVPPPAARQIRPENTQIAGGAAGAPTVPPGSAPSPSSALPAGAGAPPPPGSPSAAGVPAAATGGAAKSGAAAPGSAGGSAAASSAASSAARTAPAATGPAATAPATTAPATTAAAPGPAPAPAGTGAVTPAPSAPSGTGSPRMQGVGPYPVTAAEAAAAAAAGVPNTVRPQLITPVAPPAPAAPQRPAEPGK